MPAIAINARDDPFVEESSLPETSDLLIEGSSGLTAPVRLIYTEKGGHCGFMSSFFNTSVPSHGWLAEELSRAIMHIHLSNATYSDSAMPTSTQSSDSGGGPRSPLHNHAICIEEMSNLPNFRHL